ncbi:MAG TPA: hypothetical protein VM029_18420 [Opitutaceae bacterium]|nr:hypothetical protein [Opitutaceae bacterium]
MARLFLSLVFAALVPMPVHAAADPQVFSQTLTPEQRQRLGLAGLTAAQMAELDAAIAAFARGESTVAVQRAVQQVERQAEVKVQQAEKKAAETAVADYKKKEEPGVVARTLERLKSKRAEETRETFTARVAGTFRGWSGGTYFPLENGQVWRQTGSESNELKPMQNAEVEIYQSKNGYWRLRYDGAWITVKRLQ